LAGRRRRDLRRAGRGVQGADWQRWIRTDLRQLHGVERLRLFTRGGGQGGRNSGSYSIQGSNITFDADIATIEGYSFCVQGDLLHLTLVTEMVDSSGTGTTTIASDIVAQLQP
jgi:hypothetical protein